MGTRAAQSQLHGRAFAVLALHPLGCSVDGDSTFPLTTGLGGPVRYGRQGPELGGPLLAFFPLAQGQAVKVMALSTLSGKLILDQPGLLEPPSMWPSHAAFGNRTGQREKQALRGAGEGQCPPLGKIAAWGLGAAPGLWGAVPFLCPRGLTPAHHPP